MLNYAALVKTIGLKNLALRGAIYVYRRSGIQKLLTRYYEYDDTPPYGYGNDKPVWENIPFLTNRAVDAVQHYLLSLPSHFQERLLSAALEVANGNYLLFSYHVVHSNTPDFNYDPLEDIHWPTRKHSSGFFQFDERYGDIKRVWEQNRLQFLDPLICGYLVAGKSDKNLIRGKFLQTFDAWLSQNPYERSVAWACSQEISIRCIKLLFLFRYLDVHLDRERLKKLRSLLVLSANHVQRELTYARTQRNNHAIIEASYLLMFGQLFPETQHAQRNYSRGLTTLADCVSDQFFPDGTYIQNSFTYHRFALQGLILAYHVIRDKGLLTRLRSIFNSSLSLLYEITFGETGEFPNYGPNDGALLFNWASNDYRDLRPLQNCLALLSHKAVVHTNPELLIDALLTVPECARHFGNQYVPEVRGSYETGGLYVLKNQRASVLFKCASYAGRFPSQNDQLHVDLWIDGVPLFTDSGTYEYFSRTGVKGFQYFISTAAHNTVRIDGLEQMDKGPRFTWLSVANCRLLHSDQERLSGESDAYAGRINAHTLHRRTLSLNDNQLVVDDEIRDSAGKIVEVFWHVDATQSCHLNNTKCMITPSNIAMYFECEDEIGVNLIRTPQSLYYGSKAQRDTIVISTQPSSDNLLIRTLIDFKQ